MDTDEPESPSAHNDNVNDGTPRITEVSTPALLQGVGIPATISGSNLAGATTVTVSGTGVTATIRLLSAEQVAIALNYAAANREEIDARIRANDLSLDEAERVAAERERLLA